MKADTKRDYAERVMRVLVHIQRNLGASLKLEDLASIACFSPFHFHRIFSGMVGESVKQHVRRLRLERAAVLLKSSERPITEIAFDTGYQTHESFTRAFRAAFHQSPSEFRAAVTAMSRLDSRAGVHLAAEGKDPDFRPIPFEESSMQIEIKHLPRQRVAFLRHVGPYDQVGSAWERLCSWAGPRGLLGPDSRFLGACYDDPEITPPDKIRYDACVTVGEEVEAEGDVGLQEIGGGEYAVTLHEGPYAEFSATYSKIYGGWFPENGRYPGPGPSLEFYLNDPESTDPEDLLTEVWVPIGDPHQS